MTWLYPAWTPERSLRRGFAVWDLFYTNWGNLSLGSGYFPAPADGAIKLPDYHGIAIGSRSTVDRVWLNTQLVTQLMVGPGFVQILEDGRRVIDYIPCHVGRPLRGQVLGPVYVYNDEPIDGPFPSMYVPDNGTGVAVALTAGIDIFEAPALHLQLLQRNQDVSLLNGPRMPMFRQVNVVAPAAVGEQIIRIYPIASRRGVTFQAHVTTGVVDFRIGVIGASKDSNVANSPYIESTLANVTAVGPATPPAYIDLSGRAQYLAIYATVTTAPAAYNFDVTIADDCCGENTVQAGGNQNPAPMLPHYQQ